MRFSRFFFARIAFIAVWTLFAAARATAWGQTAAVDSAHAAPPHTVVDSVPAAAHSTPADTLHTGADTLHTAPAKALLPVDTLLASSDSVAMSDSIATLPDSLMRRRVVVGRTDALDTLSSKLFAYQVLHANSYARLRLDIDTVLERFQINTPLMRLHHTGGYLGNTGLPYYPAGFEARKRPSDFPFLDHVAGYIHDPEATVYYQTRTPYTHIDYSSGGAKIQNETVFSLLHTQNINRNWNAGLYYDVFSSLGQYTNQNTSNNGFSLFSAYRGSQYSMYTNFNWNNIRMRENGGLANTGEYETTDGEPASYVMRSGAGKSILLNRSLYLMHSYSPEKLFQKNSSSTDSIEASRFTLVHTLKYEWNRRMYTDTARYALQGKAPYYDTDARGRADTNDSLYFRRLSNHFELMIKEQLRQRFTAGFSAGILSELDRYNINTVPRTEQNIIEAHVPQHPGWGGSLPSVAGREKATYYRESTRHFNTAVTGRFFNHTGRYLNWDFSGRLYFTGYKMGDMNISGTVQMHYYSPKGRNTLLLGGSIDNAHPGYFMDRYSSKCLAWDNDFNLSQEIRLRGEFMMPHIKLKLGAYLSQLNNYVYMDVNALPAQSAEPLATGTAYIEKDIHWWKLGFMFRLYGQYSSHQRIIPLPAFAGFQSAYLEMWPVKNVLKMHLGWEVTYSTACYAYAYMPFTSMFHLQEEQKIGNYPFFDVFLNFQIKQARIFIKTEGMNTLFSDTLGKQNYMAYRYPTNDVRIKFGVSWAFYN